MPLNNELMAEQKFCTILTRCNVSAWYLWMVPMLTLMALVADGMPGVPCAVSGQQTCCVVLYHLEPWQPGPPSQHSLSTLSAHAIPKT